MNTDFVISHYRVLDAIGEGGMGEVFLGLDETLRRKVALKSIRRERRLDPATKARFLREARTLSQLDHPNICRAYDYIETPERDWIVLELVEGQTLGAAIRRGLPGADRLKIAQQIAAVLVATHAAGIVHRDLKPGNVMLTPSGDVKVLDFGLSAARPDGEASVSAGTVATMLTSEMEAASLEETQLPISPLPDGGALDVSHFQSELGSVKGTPGYMSPEQARGEVATPASDMYSYGLVLQELFTGRRPYAETSDYLELLENTRRGESLAPVGMPTHLAALVGRLKSVAPAQRPTAVDTLHRLRWIADAARRRRRNLLVAGLLLAAVLGAIKYTVDLSRERNAAILARDEADQRRGQAEGLIGFMVGDLRSKLTAVGRLEILDDVGKQALAYFASVPADTLTDEELYRRSQALHQLGQVRQARADLPGALKAYEDSLTQVEQVVRRNPDNAVWQLGLGTSHFYAGDLKMRRGDLNGALAHFQAYKSIAEKLVAKDPANFEWKLELSYGHSNVAAIYSRQGDLAKAREQLEITAGLQAELAKQRPDDRTLKASRANNYNRLGIVQDTLGNLSAAVVSFGQELALYDQLLAIDAQDARVRRRREVGHIYRGSALRALGRADEAEADLIAAVREAEALVKLDPTNADWQRDLGTAEGALGRLDLEQGRVGRAVVRFRASIDVLAPLAKKDSTRAAAQRDLAKAQLSLAEALHSAGDVATAVRQIETARAGLQTLFDKNPKDVDTTRDLAIAENVRGVFWAARREPTRAREAWTHTVALLEPVVEGSNDRNLLDPWVRALLHLGRLDEATRGYEKLSSIGYREVGLVALWQQKTVQRPVRTVP
jgi:serine/threonine protein kinase